MKTITAVLFVLLMIAGVIIYLLIRERSIAQRDEELRLKESITVKKHALAVIEARDAQISTLLNDRREDSARQAKKEAAFISRISVLKSRITGPAVVQDTIIVIQDSLISVVSNSRDTLYVTDNQVIDSLQRQVFDFSELLKGQLQESIRLQNQVDRYKRSRFSIGPHVGIGFRGADVGISIQYSLFKL